MNKFITKLAKLFLGISMAAGVGVAIGAGKIGVGQVDAVDVGDLVYTLDGTVSATGNAYASASTVTQSSIGWQVVANTEQTPWRVGGKSITAVDRSIHSTTAITENIAKIEVNSGATASSLTVNSMTISVHSSSSDASSGSNAVATQTVTSDIASSTVVFTRTDNTSWAGKYFRIVYNVTRTSSSGNGYITFNYAKFYEEAESGDDSIATTTTVTAADNRTTLYTGQNPADAVQLTSVVKDENNNTLNGVTVTYAVTTGNAVTVSSTGLVTASVVGSATITASYAGGTIGTDTYDGSSGTIEITVSKPVDPYIIVDLDFPVPGQGNTSGYTSSFTATDNNYTFTIANANNSSSQWDHIRIGRNGNASTATIISNTALSERITSVVIDFSQYSSSVTSATLYVADNSSFTSAYSKDFTSDISTSEPVSVEIPTANSAANRYYKIEFVCPSFTANGPIHIDEIIFRADPVSTTPTASLDNDEVTLYTNNSTGVTAHVTIENCNDAEIEWSESSAYIELEDDDAATVIIKPTSNAIETDVSVTLVVVGTDLSYEETLTVHLVEPEPGETQDNPYTIAQARAAITAGTGITGVYAKGIVSSIATAYSSQYHNVSYNLSDDGTTTGAQLEAYRLAAETDPGVKVGDVIIVHGNLTLYGETYEFASGCTLTKHCQIQSISVTTSPETSYQTGDNFDPTGLVISATYNNGESNHSFSYANHGTNFSFDPSTSTSLTSSDDNVAITYGNGTANLSITVTVAPAVTGITLNPTEKVAYFEDEFSITASVSVEGGASQAITWSIEDNSSLISIKNGTATNTSVTIVAGTTTGTAYVRATSDVNNTVYARCKVDIKDPDALSDTLTRTTTGVSSGAGYTQWSGKSVDTTAVYAGYTAGGNDSIQINSGYGIRNTASAGYIRQVDITFDSHSTSDRSVTLYGYTEAQSSIVNTGTNLGSATYDGTNSTETINVASQNEFEYFVLTSTKALYISEITFTYEQIDTSPSIVLIGDTVINGNEGTTDSTSVSVKVKNIVSPVFTFTYEEGGTTSSSSSYVSVVQGTPENGIYPLTITLSNPGTSIVHIDVSGQTASFTVTVVEISYLTATLPAQYRLVTDDSTLTAGDQIILVDSDKVMNSTFTNNEYAGESTATLTNGNILNSDLPAGALVFTLGGDSDGWTLANGGNYLIATAAKKIKMDSTSGEWTISINSTTGEASILFSTTSYGTILHNVNSTRFTTYTSSPNASMKLPKIYRYISGQKNVEIGTDILSAISSAESVFSCNSQGTSFDGTGFNNMSSYFTDVIKAKYFLDYVDSDESGNVVEQWLAMYDYAVKKYGSDYDFLGRIASGKVVRSQQLNLLANITGENTNSVAIIVIISMVSVTAIGGYFFSRRRKEN